MGFFRRMRYSPKDTAQKYAVDSVYELLYCDNLSVDRKRFDCVEIYESAILVTNWGFDPEEAERKQRHAIDRLVECGFIVDDHGFMKDGVMMGCIEGAVSVPMDENGGLEAVTLRLRACIDARLPQGITPPQAEAGERMARRQ